MGKQFLDKDGLQVAVNNVKEAKEIAAGAMALAQQAMESGGQDIYSTTETKTNKVWIDGKPIYRKVYNADITTYNDVSNRRTFVYTINDNIDTIISSGGCWIVKTNSSRPETVGWTQTWSVAQMSTSAASEYSSSTSATALQVMMVTALWGGVTGITIKCWVEYTKTN